MSWIKENSFVAGVAAVSLLGAVGIGYFITMQSGRYEEALDAHVSAQDTIRKNNRMELAPTAANSKAKKEAVESYESAMSELGQKLNTFRPASLIDVNPDQFTVKLSKAAETVRAEFGKSNVELPERFFLGFEAYISTPPRQSATGELSYQLDAFTWLFTELAQSDPTRLVSITRDRIPQELNKEAPGGPFQRFGMELVFEGSEASLRSVLNEIAASDKYMFDIHAMRIMNTNRLAPTQGDADFPDEVAVEDDGLGIDFGDSEADDTVSEGGQRILSQVLGREDVTVFLQADLIVFKETKTPAAE